MYRKPGQKFWIHYTATPNMNIYIKKSLQDSAILGVKSPEGLAYSKMQMSHCFEY